jgi:predicted GIY-YIG superfamily endonuclease
MTAEVEVSSTAGVYVLRHRQTGVDLYIGTSLNVPTRLEQHALRRSKPYPGRKRTGHESRWAAAGGSGYN